LTIPRISHWPPAALTANRLNRLTTTKLPAFSIQQQLSAPTQSAAPERQVTAASVASRQVLVAASPVANTAAAPAAYAAVGPQAAPFFVANPNYNSSDPFSSTLMQDPTATAAPQRVQFTSADGLTTIGIMNPFGLTRNNPSIGFFGASPAASVSGLARS